MVTHKHIFYEFTWLLWITNYNKFTNPCLLIFSSSTPHINKISTKKTSTLAHRQSAHHQNIKKSVHYHITESTHRVYRLLNL
jgi:hypothetical protein